VQKDEVIPYWEGRSMRDLIFAEMTSEWKKRVRGRHLYGVSWNNAPRHTVLSDVIYRKGLLELQAR